MANRELGLGMQKPKGAALQFPVLLDSNQALLNGLGSQSYPTSVLVGRDGVVKTIHVGMFTPQSLETEVGVRIEESQ